MRTVMASNSHWILSLKLLLLSSAVLSMAVILKFSVPVVADILVSDVSVIWSSIVLCSRPPYLYLLVNFIIISILASSKLYHDDLVDPPPTKVPKLAADSQAVYTLCTTTTTTVDDVLEKSARDATEDFAADVSENDVKSDAESEYSRVPDREKDENAENDRSRLRKEDSKEILLQKYDKKPPISSQVRNRKAAKAATTTRAEAGTASRWSKMNGHDTLDDAWKAITEGSSAPFSSRLDKSDTFESYSTAVGRNNSPPITKATKSETTFDGGKNHELRQSAAPARLTKKPSLTEEELNRRVEAFIEKFKEEMRLQREESMEKFQEMINQGGGCSY